MITKFVTNEELQHYINEWWTKGTVSSGSTGKTNINNGTVTKQVPKDELSEWIQNGWKPGRHKKK